jgi:hypothetical protein
MSNESQPDLVDLDLVDKVHEIIPASTWPVVTKRIVSFIVDNMPGTVLESLTGSYDGFEEAEQILLFYYQGEEVNDKQLLVDSFNILGAENVLYYLDSLQLQKLDDQLNSNVSSTSSEMSEVRGGTTQDD